MGAQEGVTVAAADARTEAVWTWPSVRGAARAALPWALAAVAIAARWPLRSQYLNTWDSVLFALALEDYDVTEARPHAPGYPVYIALGRLFRVIAPDPNTALVALSLALTAGSAVLLYHLILRAGSVHAAALGTALYLLAPVPLFNSVIATSYPGEAFFSLWVALAAWRHLDRPGVANAIHLAVAAALAVGFRQSSALFLGPLVAYALLRPGGGPRAIAQRAGAAVAAGVTVCLAWAVPMVRASGGLASYREATSMQTELVVFANTVFSGGVAVARDLWTRFYLYIEAELATLLPAAAVLVTAGLWAAARTRPLRRREWTTWPGGLPVFLAVWLGPALLFYLTIFNGWGEGPPGYILVVLPGFYALFAWAADGAVRVLRDRSPDHLRAATVALALTVAWAPGAVHAASWDDTLEVQVEDHDRWTEDWLALDGTFPPESTGIVARYSWAHVKWHFPEYPLWSYLPIPAWEDRFDPFVLMMETRDRQEDVSFYDAHIEGATGKEHPVPAGIERIVLFDFQLAGENGGQRVVAAGVEVQEAFLDNGWRVLYIEIDDAHPTIESYFEPRPNVPLEGLP